MASIEAMSEYYFYWTNPVSSVEMVSEMKVLVDHIIPIFKPFDKMVIHQWVIHLTKRFRPGYHSVNDTCIWWELVAIYLQDPPPSNGVIATPNSLKGRAQWSIL